MLRGLALLLCLAGPVQALELDLPASARLTAERDTSPDRYMAPVGVFADGQVAKIDIDGEVKRAAWRLEVSGLTPLQVIAPLRRQLEAAGFEIVLDCAAEECGGFDFRFATETLPGPNMYVNIHNYHFMTALRLADGTPEEVVTVLASSSANSAYLQIIQAGRLDGDALEISAEPEAPVTTQPVAVGDLDKKLLENGHVVLGELDFGTGTSELGPGPFDSLEALARFMEARPGVRVALVGHTDSVGALEGNISLSRLRARSVRQRLIDAYEVAPARMEAEGMGYLSPVASNLTVAGREANRRVEVVILSSDEGD